MTWPIVELTFWNPGDGHNPRIDPLLADPTTPLAKHGLTGIATAYARETGAEFHDQHRAWAEHLAARSLGVDGSLADVTRRFDAEGFDYFVAKGPTIAHIGYRAPELRPYCDLDVYVADDHERLARDALRAAGYDDVRHARGALGGLAQEMHGGPYGATVEVHTHLVDNLHRRHLEPVRTYLPYVERQSILGVETQVLSPNAHLALQAIHTGAAHRYSKLILLRDLEHLFQRHPYPPPALGADTYLDTAAELLSMLGRETPRRSRSGTLPGPVLAAFARSNPARWDEYAMSLPNVLALLHQPTWSITCRTALRAAGSLLPRPNRRVSIRPSAPARDSRLRSAC